MVNLWEAHRKCHKLCGQGVLRTPDRPTEPRGVLRTEAPDISEDLLTRPGSSVAQGFGHRSRALLSTLPLYVVNQGARRRDP